MRLHRRDAAAVAIFIISIDAPRIGRRWPGRHSFKARMMPKSIILDAEFDE